MSQVVIQPSFGNRDAWRHWEDTLDREVVYRSGAHAQALTQAEHAALDALHPTGAARFWGATSNHDERMQHLRQGDVILFTGKKLVRAVGEVGHSFRNAAFADTLWAPHAERGSYHSVYSLLAFQTTDIPYEEIWEVPGMRWLARWKRRARQTSARTRAAEPPGGVSQLEVMGRARRLRRLSPA